MKRKAPPNAIRLSTNPGKPTADSIFTALTARPRYGHILLWMDDSNHIILTTSMDRWPIGWTLIADDFLWESDWTDADHVRELSIRLSRQASRFFRR